MWPVHEVVCAPPRCRWRAVSVGGSRRRSEEENGQGGWAGQVDRTLLAPCVCSDGWAGASRQGACVRLLGHDGGGGGRGEGEC